MAGENMKIDDLDLDFEIENIPLDDIELSNLDSIEESEENIDITPQDLSKIEVREFSTEGMGDVIETPESEIPSSIEEVEVSPIETPAPNPFGVTGEKPYETEEELISEGNIGAMDTISIIENAPEPDILEKKEIRPVEEEVTQAREEELEQIKAQRLKFSDNEALEDAYTFESDDEIISIEGSDLDKVIYGSGEDENALPVSEMPGEEPAAETEPAAAAPAGSLEGNFELTVEESPAEPGEVSFTSEPTEELVQPVPEEAELSLDGGEIPELDIDLSIIPDIEDSDEDEPITLSMEELNNIEVSEEAEEELPMPEEEIVPEPIEMAESRPETVEETAPIPVIEEEEVLPESIAPEPAEELVEIEIEDTFDESPVSLDEEAPVSTENVINVDDAFFEDEPIVLEESPVEGAVEINEEEIMEETPELSEIELKPYEEAEMPVAPDTENELPDAELPSIEELESITVPGDIKLEPIEDDNELVVPSFEAGQTFAEPEEVLTISEQPVVLETEEPVEMTRIEPVIVQDEPAVEETVDLTPVTEDLQSEPVIEEVAHPTIRIVEPSIEEVSEPAAQAPVTLEIEEPVPEEFAFEPLEEELTVMSDDLNEPVIEISESFSEKPSLAISESGIPGAEPEPQAVHAEGSDVEEEIQISQTDFEEITNIEEAEEKVSIEDTEFETVNINEPPLEAPAPEPEAPAPEETAFEEVSLTPEEPEWTPVEMPQAELEPTPFEPETPVEEIETPAVEEIPSAPEEIDVTDISLEEPSLEEIVEIVPEETPAEEFAVEQETVPEPLPEEAAAPESVPAGSDFVEISEDSLISDDHVEIAANELDILQSEVADQEQLSPEMYSLDKITPTPPAAKAQVIEEKVDGLSGATKEEIKKVMGYLDSLLDNLPEDKIKEFSQSEYYDLYVKILDKLGV